jgi:hypothetical protein
MAIYHSKVQIEPGQMNRAEQPSSGSLNSKKGLCRLGEKSL